MERVHGLFKVDNGVTMLQNYYYLFLYTALSQTITITIAYVAVQVKVEVLDSKVDVQVEAYLKIDI